MPTDAAIRENKVREEETKKSRPRAMIAGPAAPDEQQRWLDKDADEESKAKHAQFNDMREMVLQIGKRSGYRSQFDLRAPSDQRRKKRTGVEKVLAAPSTPADDEEDQEAFGRTTVGDDIIIPPYDFVTLCTLFENSGALRQNIDAMVTNIDGFGHRFEPILNFDHPDIDGQIRDLLLRKNIEEKTEDTADLLDLDMKDIEEATPSDEEVQKTKALWQSIAMIEKGRAESFFKFINPLKPFIEVRGAMRQARELMGNAAWEILREDPLEVTSRINQVYTIPFVNIRLMRADRKTTTMTMTIRKDAVHFDTVEVDRHFRRYVRQTGQSRVYYKEFGDPRVISRETGMIYETFEDLQAEEAKDGKEVKPANELFHWDIRSEISAYGVARWMGALLSVLGSRAAEEVNFLYFDNKAIPPMVLLCSGGRVSEESVTRLENYMEERIKGRENFHKIMILEGLPADADLDSGAEIEHNGKLRIELKPLFSEMQQDALFQKYDANCVNKIGRAFRQPPIMTGDTKDMNRSTAEVAKAMAEEQIYQPARDEFDAVMNRHFMTNLKIHFWKFVTNAPVQRIPNDLVANAKRGLESGGMVPNEARELLADAFSMELPYIDEEWANTPPKLALEALRQGAQEGTEGPTEARLASSIEGSEGEVIATGMTGESGGDDHAHRFAVTREEGTIKVTIHQGGETPHTHTAEITEAPSPGAEVLVVTSRDNDHTHDVKFEIPMTKRMRRAFGLAGMAQDLRAAIRQEVEQAKDEFFTDKANEYQPYED